MTEQRELSADQITRERQELVSWLKVDQIFNQYVRSAVTDSGRGAPITEPWMALGEQRSRAFILLHEEAPLDSIGREALTPLERLMLGKALLRSQTYMWQQEILTTALSCPMPTHVISRDVLGHPDGMYFSFEHAFPYSTTHERAGIPGGRLLTVNVNGQRRRVDAHNVECDGIQLFATEDGFRFIDHGFSDGNSHPMVLSWHVPYGATFPDDFDNASRWQVGSVLAMISFLKSRYTSNTVHKLPRAWRRSQKLHRTDRDRLIRVVAMRQSASAAVQSQREDEESKTHTKHRVRWWVSGHHRAQWYPSKQSHEVVWIAPYLKGPVDAPILKKVYAVTR
jgi:hypothetical protein